MKKLFLLIFMLVVCAAAHSVFAEEKVTELPEYTVEGKQKKLLHILAYVREYSTLTSYTDTVSMFREKLVDFMLPADSKTRFGGWRLPRVLTNRSYYQFTNSDGLDSVSDKCGHHFTWSDWVGIIPATQIPASIIKVKNGVDTVFGRYSPTEIWKKEGDRISLDINVMADPTSRKWVPNISNFFKDDGTEFEVFRLQLNYDNVLSEQLTPLDLTRYTFDIESRGRSRGMFQFNRYDQPFYVSTRGEVYIVDKEYISVKEAKKWAAHKFSEDEDFTPADIEIFKPLDAPALDAATLALIERVDDIDADQVRLTLAPDEKMLREISRGDFSFGHRAFTLLKQLTGVTAYKYRKNLKDGWNKFRDSRKSR